MWQVSSTTVQDLPACEASIDTDKKIENLEAVVGHGVAPSPMKHQETRATRMAATDAILVGEAGKSTGNTDGVLGSAVEDMNEQLKEELDNVEGLEVKCLREEDPVEDMNEQLKEKLDNVEGLEVKCLTEEDPVEDMNEQLKEKLDNVEGLEVKCLTEEDPGILEEKSLKSGLFLNTLASSEGMFVFMLVLCFLDRCSSDKSYAHKT